MGMERSLHMHAHYMQQHDAGETLSYIVRKHHFSDVHKTSQIKYILSGALCSCPAGYWL